MSGPLAGRAALVTGGGRGVGRAIAEALGAAGAGVAVVARTAVELEAAAAAVSAAGGRGLAVVADVTDRDEVARAVAEAERALGPLELLVANAGTLEALGPAWEVDPDAWRRDLETSVLGAFHVARAGLPGLVARGGGRLVLVASHAGTRPSPYLSGYAAAKAAVLSLAESLAAETAPHGVRVFAITPGFVHTGLTHRLTGTEEGRRWTPDAGTRGTVEPERAAALVVRIALGEADPLAGGFIHAAADLDELLSRARPDRGPATRGPAPT